MTGTPPRPGPLERIALRMRLRPGMQDEYRRRHDALWPELAVLLRQAGATDYSIYLDPETNALYATLLRPADHGLDRLAEEPVMRRWWASMAPLMETNPDDSPVVVPLQRMFHLP